MDTNLLASHRPHGIRIEPKHTIHVDLVEERRIRHEAYTPRRVSLLV